MKPNFALSLSFDGIRLMHRSATGWTIVGDVALDSADLAGELAMLRKTALSLDPAGLRTKLLLPNDQIKYLSLDTTRATEDDVRAALDGATPYPVADLAYDHVRAFGRTYIAAVARETLAEAEAFATEHRFAPVSFAGVPEEFTYQGEAFFGQTKASLSLLPPGEKVERDAEPVKVASKPARKAVAEAQVADLPETKLPEAALPQSNLAKFDGPLSDLAKSDKLQSDLSKSDKLLSDLDKSDLREPAAPDVADLAPVTTAPPEQGLSKTVGSEQEIAESKDQAGDTPDLTGVLPADVAPTEVAPALMAAPVAAIDQKAAPPLEDVQGAVDDPVAEANVPAALPGAEPPLALDAPVFASRARPLRALKDDDASLASAAPAVAPIIAAPVIAPPTTAPASEEQRIEPVFSRRTPPPPHPRPHRPPHPRQSPPRRRKRRNRLLALPCRSGGTPLADRCQAWVG